MSALKNLPFMILSSIDTRIQLRPLEMNSICVLFKQTSEIILKTDYEFYVNK